MLSSDSIIAEVGIAASYGVVGLVLMALGFVLVDVLTPGNLRKQIWLERNRNASMLLASNLLGVGIVVVTAIRASEDAFLPGLLSAAAYGILGLVLMGLSFLVLDAVTPGKLGAMLMEDVPHPATWVSSASHIAVAAIVASAIY